jgi:hypothetical protein
MGGAPNYKKGRANMKRMADGKAKGFAQNIIIEQGKGRYPNCLKLDPKPYYFCPKLDDIPDEPKNVPNDCKYCQEYIKSKFWDKTTRGKRLKRLRDSGMPTQIVS